MKQIIGHYYRVRVGYTGPDAPPYSVRLRPINKQIPALVTNNMF